VSVTVRAVLFGDTAPAAVVAGTPGWRAVVDGLDLALSAVSPAGRVFASAEVASALAELLELDVADVLIGGWRTHRSLIEAAAATRDDPEASEIVRLATHRIGAAHRPYVEVVVNGATIATVDFELSVELDIDAVLATVRRARLVAVHGGRLTMSVTLTAAGRELVSRAVTLDPAVTVSLGDGVTLLPDDAPARGQAQVLKAGDDVPPGAGARH
jgi:hypothetical protein